MRTNRFYSGILLIIIIFGHLWILIPSFTSGFVITAYRAIIPLFTVYSFSRYCQTNRIYTKSFGFFLIVMGVWILWGMFLLTYSSYVSLKEGTKEMLSILLGICSVICIYKSVNSTKDFENIIITIKIITIFLVLMAWFETFTNWHLASSSLIENEHTIFKYGKIKLYGSSTIFYNVNDFYAFLGIMSTLFFEKFYKPSGIFLLVSSFLLMVLNDANICLIAVAGAFLMFEMVKVHSMSKKAIVFVAFLTAFIMCNTILTTKFSLYSIKDIFYVQIENTQRGVGSLYNRISMYLESIEIVIITHGLGLGPAGFSPYFLAGRHTTNLINPHNYWLEVLSQYGIAVFVLYIAFFIREIWRMFKIYKKKHTYEAAVLIAMCTAFIVASIAPSSFLTYSYQWVVLALCISLEKISVAKKKNDKEYNYKK